MTASFCSNCGAERSPGAGFCASCGAPAAAAVQPAPAGQPPVPPTGQWNAPYQPPQPPQPQYEAPSTAQLPAQPQYSEPQQQYQQPTAQQPAQPQQPTAQQPALPQPPYPGQQPPQQAWGGQPQHPGQQPQYPGQQPQYPGQQGYPGQQPQYPGQQPFPGQQPQYPGQQPFPGQPAPWGAAPSGAPKQPGKNLLDALLTGDWGGAAKAAGIAVAVMLGISLVGTLIVTEGGVGFRETVALVFAFVCLAVGGDAYVAADSDEFGGGSITLGVLPLTVTLAGLGVLGWLFAKRLRSRGPAATSDLVLQGVRTALVFTACFLPLSLLTRYNNDDFNELGLTGRLGVGVFSSVFGALLFAVAALGITWLFHRHTALPGKVGAFRDRSLAPLVGAVAVFSVGVLAVLVALVYGLIEEDDKAAQIGVALLGGGNGALSSVLFAAGVPLNLNGTASSPLGEVTPDGSDSVDLFTFTDGSGWFWLAPLVLLATMVLVATALAVRQNTIEDARREGFRFAGALALVAFLATLLLRIGFGGEAGEFGVGADGSAMFNPIVAAFVLALWGVVTGLLAPVVAAKIGSGFVMNVRRRFGAAAPTPPPVQ